MQKNRKSGTPCVASPSKAGRISRAIALLLLLLLPLSACKTDRAGEAAPASPAQSSLTVYLDAGHGGFDLGAVGELPDGRAVAEKDIALAAALAMQKTLAAAGHTVILSRADDSRLTYTNSRDELLARRAAAAAADADLLLSVHVNAYRGEGRAFGPRVYYHPENQAAAEYAERLSAAVSQHTGAIIGRECRTVADGSYLLLQNAAVPALIFEIGFLTDREELARLTDPAYLARLACAVGEAL